MSINKPNKWFDIPLHGKLIHFINIQIIFHIWMLLLFQSHGSCFCFNINCCFQYCATFMHLSGYLGIYQWILIECRHHNNTPKPSYNNSRYIMNCLNINAMSMSPSINNNNHNNGVVISSWIIELKSIHWKFYESLILTICSKCLKNVF